VRPGIAAFIAAAVVPLAGCGGSGKTEEGEWAGPPRPDDRGRVAVDGFNDYLDGHRDDAGAPVVAATRFLRLDRATAGETSVVVRTAGEGEGPATVTVTLDRLLDDSVRAQRFVLVLRQEGGGWRLESAASAQRCQPNRGHQGFSPEPCV
jgi:hypothetical protein